MHSNWRDGFVSLEELTQFSVSHAECSFHLCLCISLHYFPVNTTLEVTKSLTFKTTEMFSQSVILCANMHLFNNIVLVHAVTAVLITLTGSCFITFYEKACVIKWRLHWLFFLPKIIQKGIRLDEIIWRCNMSLGFFETQCSKCFSSNLANIQLC